MPHIYTPSIQASICPLGPHPGAPVPALPTANARPPASVRRGNQVSAHLGLQVPPAPAKSAAIIRPSTRKEIHTTPIIHTRREMARSSLQP